MGDTPKQPETPRRPTKEFEDHHFHDEDEIAPLPADDADAVTPATSPRLPQPVIHKLPPRARRFFED